MSENESNNNVQTNPWDNYRITKLRTYLVGVINTNSKDMNIDYLSSNVDRYSLDKIPTETLIEKWITGLERHREVYSLRSRMNYSSDVVQNLMNIGFFESFKDTIAEKNKKGELPSIDGIENIACLNCGTMNNANTNTAEFDIQVEIIYRKEV